MNALIRRAVVLASGAVLAYATTSAAPAGAVAASPDRSKAAAVQAPIVVESAEGVPVRQRRLTPDGPLTFIPAVNSHLLDICASGTCVSGVILVHVRDVDSGAHSNEPVAGFCTSGRTFELSRLVDTTRDRRPGSGGGIFARGDRVELTFTEFPAGEVTAAVVITLE